MQIETAQTGISEDAHERTYHLTCDVKKKTVSRINNEKSYETTIFYLVPRTSGESIRFYEAFLPDYVTEVNNNEHVFLNLKSGHAFRGSLSPANKDIPERHIFVMSDDEKEFLSNVYREDLSIRIDCIPFSEQPHFNA